MAFATSMRWFLVNEYLVGLISNTIPRLSSRFKDANNSAQISNININETVIWR